MVTLSQVAFYHLNMNCLGNVIFSVSLLSSQVGGVGPHSTLEEGEGVVTLSQVAFYCLNMNG